MRKMNPKHIQAQKDGKIPYEYLVLSVLEDDAYVHEHGGDKYGKRNWQIDEILASTYVGAMFRHLIAWAEGEDIDSDSGKPHLTHLRACAAVVMDADRHDKLIDDRLFAETKAAVDETVSYRRSRLPFSPGMYAPAPTPPNQALANCSIVVLQHIKQIGPENLQVNRTKAFGPFPDMNAAGYFADSLRYDPSATIDFVTMYNVSKLRTKKC